MWTKPWKFKEGMAMGAGLVATGLALQACLATGGGSGKIEWGMMAWPVNGIVLGLFFALLVAMHCLRRRVYLFRYLSTYHAAVCSLLWVVVLTIVMGLCRQVPSHMEIDGLLGIVGLQQMLSAWHLTLIYTWLMTCLGLAILRVLGECFGERKIFHFSFFIFHFIKRLPFFINHLGLFIAIVAATLGSADMQRLQMMCYLDRPEWRGVSYDFDIDSDFDGRKIVELSFAVELHEFTMEEYASRMPKRFASDVTVYARKASEGSGSKSESIIAQGTVEVNKPLDVAGWKIYQSGYDSALGTYSPYSIFDLVRDPWLPAVYVGIYLLLLGAGIMIIQAAVSRSVLKSSAEKSGRGRIITVVAIALAFSVMAYFFVPIITNKELMPALQSPWFAPHVLVYMFAYTLLAATVLLAAVEFLRKPRNPKYPKQTRTSMLPIIDNLVYAGNALIAIGMLFGALWAKEAWGHYWSWDPKETWAAITWFAYLGYIHYRKLQPNIVSQGENVAMQEESITSQSEQPASSKSFAIPLIILIISFILLNMCWWGINYLPSAQGVSVHTYS